MIASIDAESQRFAADPSSESSSAYLCFMKAEKLRMDDITPANCFHTCQTYLLSIEEGHGLAALLVSPPPLI